MSNLKFIFSWGFFLIFLLLIQTDLFIFLSFKKIAIINDSFFIFGLVSFLLLSYNLFVTFLFYKRFIKQGFWILWIVWWSGVLIYIFFGH